MASSLLPESQHTGLPSRQTVWEILQANTSEDPGSEIQTSAILHVLILNEISSLSH